MVYRYVRSNKELTIPAGEIILQMLAKRSDGMVQQVIINSASCLLME